jgi:hypothetical protein
MNTKLTEEEFYALDKAEQRVVIAQDVLDMLNKPEKEVPIRVKGAYGYIRGRVSAAISKNYNLQKILQTFTPEKPCSVCARGALLYSKVVNFNRSNAGFCQNGALCIGRIDTYEGLEDVFSLSQLNLIENYFEYGVASVGAFGCNVNAPTRLKRIMENIIRNKGEFQPHK